MGTKKEFKQFDIIDTVDDDDDENNKSIHDHHFYYASSTNLQQPKKYSSLTIKKIMQEWDILDKSLPDSIYVRAYEGRIYLLRAVIIGAPGTPYHDGIFFFDIQLPCDYPNQPPKVYYHSFGYELNPNLYTSGSVCLSLLNTFWCGGGNARWIPSESTVLQVLVSIQALVLNAKPYFNEFLALRSTYPSLWENTSLAYNQDVFLLSCKTMLAVLNRPPKHFEEFVAQHFREHSETILIACKAYVNGRVKVGDHPIIENTQSTSSSSLATNPPVVLKRFWDSMGDIYPQLVQAFRKNGSSLVNYQGDNIFDENSSKNLVDDEYWLRVVGVLLFIFVLLLIILLILFELFLS